MRLALAGVGVALVFSAAVFGQAPAAAPSFDVADVHVRAHSSNPNPSMSGGVLRGGRYDLRNASILNLISMAYDSDPTVVLGGPNWLDRNRFDIIAKAPVTTPPATLDLMLQTLLSDRFKLVLHKDTKPIPSFALTVVNGRPKMKASSASEKRFCESVDNAQPIEVPFTAISCHGVTMASFAAQLRGWGNGYVTTRVVDLTNLKGSWDFDLKWTARNNVALAGADGITLFQALEQQLGLKLDFVKLPGPVLVVDSVNDKPTDNPSGVAQNLPAPPPAEFDVADIKLSLPDAPSTGRLTPGGRLDFEGFTMKQLVKLAWDINDDELLGDAPKWFDTTKYTLVAKAASAIAGNGDQIDIDDVRLMLRALLADRFKLTTHLEDRPVSAYTLLIADKPKLQPADPANRTNWINGPALGAKDPREASPILNRFVTCQNMTMAQFAEDLSRIAAGYLQEPVVDATGLEGAWDFTLNFTGVNRLQAPAGPGGGVGGAGAVSAADPSGGLSLFDAMRRQLGLRLELRKRQMPVLVIDRVEEKPSDN